MVDSTPLDEVESYSDRLTIGRMLLLVAGLAIGLGLFVGQAPDRQIRDAGMWRMVLQALAIGLALPAPALCLPRALGNRRLGPGGLYALAAGLGVIIMLPAAVIEIWMHQHDPSYDRATAGFCLGLVLSMFALWYLLAAVMAGHVGRRLWSAQTPWTDRYGFFLALVWSPLGVWWVIDIYADILR